jgi:hypothetical protein
MRGKYSCTMIRVKPVNNSTLYRIGYKQENNYHKLFFQISIKNLPYRINRYKIN